MDQIQRLAAFTPRWRLTIRDPAKTPPHDSMLPYELRALTEQTAVDRFADLHPNLEIVQIDRCPSV
jgi:hypothetical protein